MKKFKVIYVDQNNITNVFKVIAKDKNHAVMILRKKINSYATVLNVIEVKDKPRKSWAEVNIVVACALAFIIVLTLACTCNARFTKPIPVDYERYVVQSGDTLWEIGMMSNGWNHFDNSYIINHIEERSDCSALIYPGQVVYIPIYEVK